MGTPGTTPSVHGIETSLRILSGKWKLLILWHLFQAPRRYGALRRLIPTITEKMLIRQLRELEQDGIISRTCYQTVPPRVEYAITSYGHSLHSILEAMCTWGRNHLQHEEGGSALVALEPGNGAARGIE